MPIIIIFRNPLFFGAYSNWPIGVSDALYKNMDAAVGKYEVIRIIMIISMIIIKTIIIIIINIIDSLYMAGEACGQEFTGTIFGAQDRFLYKLHHNH